MTMAWHSVEDVAGLFLQSFHSLILVFLPFFLASFSPTRRMCIPITVKRRKISSRKAWVSNITFQIEKIYFLISWISPKRSCFCSEKPHQKQRGRHGRMVCKVPQRHCPLRGADRRGHKNTGKGAVRRAHQGWPAQLQGTLSLERHPQEVHSQRQGRRGVPCRCRCGVVRGRGRKRKLPETPAAKKESPPNKRPIVHPR